MAGGAVDGAEGGGIQAEPTRMRLSSGEELPPQAAPAVLRQHDALGEIQEVSGIQPGRPEGGAEGLLLIRERQAGGGSEGRSFGRQREDGQRARAPQVDGEVVTLIGRVPVVEIGELAEDADAQFPERGNPRCEVRAGDLEETD
jgi:hypothetical protein